jgi:hypothetical protein
VPVARTALHGVQPRRGWREARLEFRPFRCPWSQGA